ncbi:NACHT domain-containing protein [Actinoallomurus bryophytorum]|uniref:NACHT domain-containing protein n=1 Tax=Actinoallomurus bryophytorum TaxID=1490222 RepID=A0A543CIE0_9ACTN|nr:NACHT domain-containing protein [Actinoallomurus bryophytorum]TQL96872.1 NACHT domain-containing protein [Actinoallomurus bryophytorum]
MTDIVLGLGAAVVKAACKVWLKDHAFAADTSAAVIDVINARVSGTRERRRVQRLFEDLEETVADKLQSTLKHEFGGLPVNERNAAVLAVTDTFDGARLVEDDIFAADLDPLFLERNVRAEWPDAVRDLAPPAAALYDRVLGECCAYIIEVARDLPAFDAGAFTEILRRQSQILGGVRELLDRVPGLGATSPDEAFTGRYRYQVANILDRLELFGVTAADSVRRYPLSLAYIRLRVSSPVPDRMTGPVTVDDALARGSRLFLRGDAGSGKTTLLQWLAVRAATGDLSGPLTSWNDSVPFLIPLRRYVGRALPAPEDFLSQAGRHIADEMPEGWVRRRLAGGRALVLVDGIDELPEAERAPARAWLGELTAAYPAARYVVTSRPTAAGEDWLSAEDFDSAELRPMSWPDIEEFVRHWHSAVGGSRVDEDELTRLRSYEEALLGALRSRRHLRALAVTPLLCALLCALHLDRRTQLPRDRMELYGIALEMLLERRDVERRIRGNGPDLSYTDKLLLLQDLAYWLIRNGMSDAPVDRAVERIAHRLSSMYRLSADASTVFGHLLVRSGLLREPVAGRVDFVHRTFQEYLAARAAIEADDVGALVKNAHHDQWREVVVMAAGHAQPRQREELLRMLLDRGDNDGDGWQALHVLAVACLETSPQLAPDTYARIQQVAGELLPPRSRSDADALARAGEFVLDLLAERPVTTNQHAAPTIRLAAAIGGDTALEVIARCARFVEPLAELELNAAWDRFDADRFAQKVLAHSPHAAELTIGGNRMDQIRALRHVTVLRALNLTSVPEELDLDENLPRHSLTKLKIINCDWLTRLLPALEAEQLRDLEVLEMIGCGPRSLHELSRWAGTLRELAIWPAAVSDIGSLPPLPELQDLFCIDVRGSLAPLREMPALRRLTLGAVEPIDLTPLQDLKRLERLELYGSTLFDHSPLMGREGLTIHLNEDGRIRGATVPLSSAWPLRQT